MVSPTGKVPLVCIVGSFESNLKTFKSYVGIVTVLKVSTVFARIKAACQSLIKRPVPHCKLHTWVWYSDGIGLYCSVCGFNTLQQNGFTGP
mgnify:CR=1 FL=1